MCAKAKNVSSHIQQKHGLWTVVQVCFLDNCPLSPKGDKKVMVTKGNQKMNNKRVKPVSGKKKDQREKQQNQNKGWKETDT